MTEKTVLPINKKEIENNNNFKSALKFEIEFPNGTISQLITIFNGSAVNFEDLVKHTHNALAEKSNHNIKAVTTTLGSLINGGFKSVAEYGKEFF